MVSTVFSDYIVSATDLRAKQREWLEKAYEKPKIVHTEKMQARAFVCAQADDQTCGVPIQSG